MLADDVAKCKRDGEAYGALLHEVRVNHAMLCQSLSINKVLDVRHLTGAIPLDEAQMAKARANRPK